MRIPARVSRKAVVPAPQAKSHACRGVYTKYLTLPGLFDYYPVRFRFVTWVIFRLVEEELRLIGMPIECCLVCPDKSDVSRSSLGPGKQNSKLFLGTDLPDVWFIVLNRLESNAG